MKTNNITLLSILCLSLLAYSCSSDDDGPAPEPEPTVQELVTETGRWYMDYIENEVMDGCDKTSYYEFDEDMVTETWFYTDDSSGDCLSAYSETNNIEWLSDTKFRVLDDDYPYEITIKSITETEMTADFYSIVGEETSEMVLDKNPGDG